MGFVGNILGSAGKAIGSVVSGIGKVVSSVIGWLVPKPIIPSGYAGTNLEIVKAYDRATGTNVYKVRANTPTGSQFLFSENGKEFTSTDVNAAKVLISQQINGK
jgi:hypothetical protein